MMRKGKPVGILLPLLAIVLTVVLLFSVLQIVRFSLRPQEPIRTTVSSKTIVRDGIEYFPRQDIDVLLVMGIDKYGPVEASGSYNNDGEADTVMLLVFDHGQQCVRILNLNRDTMTEMPVLGIGGKQAGTAYGQLALSHTYGSGLEDSCENTRRTVSALLGGISIDYYAALHMDAIAAINDAVGGVAVTVQDDFGGTESDLPLGETILRGQQAIDFVRIRKGVGDQLNVSRMERQKEFITGFFSALREKMDESAGFVIETYESVSQYIVTDCSSTVLSSMLERYGDYTLSEPLSLPGESRKGEEHMEFYPDEEAMDRIVLEMFYAPK